MVWLAVLAGAVIGLAVGDDGEWGLAGALFGWLLWRSLRQQRELDALRRLLPKAAVAAPPPLVAESARQIAPVEVAPPVAAEVAAPARADDTTVAPPPAPAAAPAVTASPRPSPLALARQWLFGGNTIVKAGVGILFIGLAFLARYAAEQVQVAVEFRLAGIGAVAIALLAVGWRLRLGRPGYAQVLQGGAVAVLYLVLFAAFRFYGVIAAGPAFALMAAVALLAAALAVLQDARALAVIGALGGFATPLLVSTGGGNFVALFAYYLVLDLGIAAVAWHRHWRALNLIGFFATFIVATVWGVLRYRPDDYLASQLFLIAFFALFVAIALLPGRLRREPAAGWIDGTLLFGLPTIVFVLQWGLVRQWPYAVAFSALGLAAAYVGLAAWARPRPRLALAFEASLGIAVVFLTLVIPFALDAGATAGAWALEGAGLVWIGFRQSRRLARAAGYALVALGGIALAGALIDAAPATRLADPLVLGAAMVAAAALFAALQVQRQAQAGAERLAEPALLGWATLWLLLLADRPIDGLVAPGWRPAAWLLALSLIALLLAGLSLRLRWPKAAWPAWLHAPALTLLMLATTVSPAAPLQRGGWWAWPAALATHLALLRFAVPAWPAPLPAAARVLGIAVLAGLLAMQGRAWTAGWGDAGSAWRWLGWGVPPALLLLALLQPAVRARWPVAADPLAYLRWGGALLAGGLLGWTLLANWDSDGGAAPLPHLPLLNPLDLGIAVALMAAWRWREQQAADGLPFARGTAPIALLAACAFAWLNAVLIRGFHHYAGVPYRLDDWSRSLAVQSGLALLWSATALALMWRSARAQQRAPWMAGAALLGAVVLKLLLIDLSGTGTVTRIVSFIGVGALMLVIGYVAPLPARRQEAVDAAR